MTTLTKKELCATSFLAKQMVLADGHIDEKEVRIMSITMDSFGVSLKEMENIYGIANTMDFADAIIVMKEASAQAKRYACAMLGTIIAADGDASDSEMALWKFVSQMCDFPTMNIEEAQRVWRE